MRAPPALHRLRRAAMRLAALALLAPLSAAQEGALLPLSFEDDAVAAQALGTEIRWRDLDATFLTRRVLSRDGRDALRHLAQSRLLERLAEERGVRPAAQAVRARRAELEKQIALSGDARGLAGWLARAHLDEAEFERYLRLAMVHEVLTRRSLGLPQDAPLTEEQQNLWIEHELAAHGYAELPYPWSDGLAARAADFTVRLDELVRALRSRLPEEDVREDAYQVLLERRIVARMPDLAPAALAEYVGEELARRRAEVGADPRYKGLPYEKLLAGQGIVPERIAEDPAVRIAALSRAWVDRSYDAETQKRVYADEREWFDRLYGEAIDTSMVFLRAAEFVRDPGQRAFREAEAELRRRAALVRSRADLERLAREISEDADTREKGGAMGWITPGNPRVPAEVRAQVERALEKARASPGAESALGLAGPVRVANGCVLLWLGARRPAPSWEVMSAHVHRELRRRFLEEVLPRSALVTVFDGH